MQLVPGDFYNESILGENSSAKWEAMKTETRAELSESVKKYIITNGVFQNYGEPIARFGTAYDYRTMIAIAVFGANPVDVAIYLRAETDEDGETLTGKNSYVLHFKKDSLPPVKDKGFWSITVYGDDNFLVDNELNRYCINDRSNVHSMLTGHLIFTFRQRGRKMKRELATGFRQAQRVFIST